MQVAWAGMQNSAHRVRKIFAALEGALIELEHALADFMCDIAPLRNQLNFVGLETNLLNIQLVCFQSIGKPIVQY